MKTSFAASLTVVGALALGGVTAGHGGAYKGPGDTVPPGGGGDGGSSGPVSPGPSGPSSPGGTSPTSPGGTSPTSPASSPSGGTTAPTTGLPDVGVDLTHWEFWWVFNQHPYLNLKQAIHGEGITTGSDEFFLGQGQTGKALNRYKPTEEQIRQQIVPALLRALATETNNDIVTGALVALAKIGDPSHEDGEGEHGFAEVIEAFVSDSNREISETAAVALGILGNDSSTPILTDLAFNTEEGRRRVTRGGMANEVPDRTRAFAVYGLGLVGFQSEDNGIKQGIVADLVRLMETDARTSSHRDLGVAALSALGLIRLDSNPDFVAPEDPQALPDLAPQELCLESQMSYLLAAHADPTVRHLVRAHGPTAMARLLQSPDPTRQFENHCDLQHHGLKTSVAETLLDGLSPHSKLEREVQASCILGLGMIGDCDNDEIDISIRKVLARVPENVKDQQARHFSLLSLGQVSGRPGLHGSEPLAGLRSSRMHLAKKLTGGGTQERPWASLAIGVMERALAERSVGLEGSSSMASALRIALAESKTNRDIGAFAIAAGILGDEESKAILRRKLDTCSQEETRGHCAIALGLLRDLEAKEQIQAIVEDSKFRPNLLRSSSMGLGMIGDKDVVPTLQRMLKDANSLASQASISGALGFIGDQRSIATLIEMLEDDSITPLARGFAAVSLGIVGDKETLPWNAKISTNSNYRANTTSLTGNGGTGILDIL